MDRTGDELMSRIMRLSLVPTRWGRGKPTGESIIERKESMPRFGPTVYVTYDESTGEYRIGETAKGMRSRNTGGRGWPKSEKVIIDIPAPADKRERLAVETALIQHYRSLGSDSRKE